MQKINHQDWQLIYKLAALAAFASIAIIPIQIVFFIIWPLPTDVLAWFERYQQNWLLGLIGLDILLILQNVLILFFYLGLVILLWSTHRAIILLATTFGFIGIGLYFSSNTSFEMLSLSQQYYLSDNPEVQNQLLGAGHMALATFIGAGFNVYYIMSGFALILFSWAMLSSDYFSKFTAYIGLAAGVLMLVPATAGTLGLTMSLLSLIPWVVFCFLVGKVFIKQLHK